MSGFGAGLVDDKAPGKIRTLSSIGHQPQFARTAGDVPLVVDLDGTLAKVDTLHETFLQLAATQPLKAFMALLALGKGRTAFKAAIAGQVSPDWTTLPVDEAVLGAIREARKDGREVYLATASDKRVAEGVANAFGEFNGVFASEGQKNLKGQEKADRLIDAFGLHGFDYIGNASADLPVWQAARTALISGATLRLTRQFEGTLSGAIVLGARKFNILPYLRALRPHQWLKNSLVALPAIAGHDFSFDSILVLATAFLSFSLAASSIYLVNDMVDLPHDRAHAEKRHRPLAAGDMPVSHALALFVLVASFSVALALSLPWAFMLVLAFYGALAMAYSFYLKRKLMIDVVALAALYGIRVVAGGAATDIPLSDWLVGFCFFIFLSLALVKRATEMIAQPEASTGSIKGRGYCSADLPMINALAGASGIVSALVLSLYINTPDVKLLYERPQLLWGIGIVLVYWLGRVLLLTGRGEMRQDPVLFAATDRVSLLAGAFIAGLFLLAL